MKARTKSGFSVEIDPEVMDDWETLEDLAKADSGHMQSLIDAMKRIIGESGYDSLKEHVRKLSANGKVSTKKMQEEFSELITSIAPKN